VASKDFIVRIPARLLKDSSISANARILWSVIAAHADGHSGETYVTAKTLERCLNWGRRKREQAQAELCRHEWLFLKWRRGLHGKFARRTFVVPLPKPTAVQFERSGETEQLISHHSQSQVKSSDTTSLTATQIPRNVGMT
jgi:hypothetical protein